MDKGKTFRALHQAEGAFVIPNPWDIGTAKLFASFGFNRDSSVFVGASGNAASPVVLILLRVTRRELTLCEHRASDPSAVAPQFSPDSQRIYFQSDREGKPAIYCMRVEKLVEKTEVETK